MIGEYWYSDVPPDADPPRIPGATLQRGKALIIRIGRIRFTFGITRIPEPPELRKEPAFAAASCADCGHDHRDLFGPFDFDGNLIERGDFVCRQCAESRGYEPDADRIPIRQRFMRFLHRLGRRIEP